MAELALTSVSPADHGRAVAMTAATGTDFFRLDDADQRVVLLLANAGAKNAVFTLKAGDGLLAAKGDYPVAVAAGATVALPMTCADSARVKTLAGQNAGTVSLTEALEGGGVTGLSAGVLCIE